MKKVYVFSNNYCEEAQLEAQRLINIIRKTSTTSSYLYTNNIADADLIIYYSCGHVQSIEVDSINTIRRILNQKKTSSELIVWGCLSKINPESVRRIFRGTLVGPEDWAFFYELFDRSTSNYAAEGVTANMLSVSPLLELTNPTPLSRIYVRTLRFRRFLDTRPARLWRMRIESGCSNCCTYCSDKLAFRSLKSQPIESIIQQFSLGLKNGYKYFSLEGRDQGSYGRDIDLSLADLLQEINKKYPHEDYKLILDQVSPNTLIEIYPDLNSEILSRRIFEIGSHIQSGSDSILKLMGKNFKACEWIEVIKNISANYPKIRLLTSMIVGFPSESDTDFRASMNLINEVLFDEIFVYSYSERPGLPSLKIRGRIPEKIKRERMRRMKLTAKLNTYQKRISRIFFSSTH
jgi:MiaB/RimO family radical SAM methylthiotransferase